MNYSKRLSVLVLMLASACGGSTSFEVDGFPEIILVPGSSDRVVLPLGSEGSHAGEFTLTAEATDGLSVMVSPQTVEVDGVVDITVTVTAADDAPVGNGSVQVSAERTKGDIGASIGVAVEVLERQDGALLDTGS